MRQYNGRISFVPAPGFEAYGEPTSYKSESTSSKHNACSPSEAETMGVQGHGYQGTDIDLGNSDWRTISGPFVSVWLHNVPWGSEDTMAAPQAKVRTSSAMPLIHLRPANFNFFLYYFSFFH